jgi:hypothetical protein
MCYHFGRINVSVTRCVVYPDFCFIAWTPLPSILAYFPSFEKIERRLWDYLAVCLCIRLSIFPSVCISSQIFVRRRTRSSCFVGVCVPLSLLGNGPSVSLSTIFFSLSVHSMSRQRKVGDYFFPELLLIKVPSLKMNRYKIGNKCSCFSINFEAFERKHFPYKYFGTWRYLDWYMVYWRFAGICCLHLQGRTGRKLTPVVLNIESGLGS